jgi:hypothetical protein
MAFAATMQWDVRTTGSDANGGGFDPTAGTPGTDYSLQDSPQVTYTDLVIDGTTNTKCTSAGFPFTSAHVGNVINIASGTGFSVQRVQILSVTAAVATCDKSLGTLSSTGGNGVLGGSLLTPTAAVALAIANNTVHIKAGTYTKTTTITVSTAITLAGYGTTHNDGGTKPLITTATNSINLFTYNATVTWRNLSMSHTAGTRANCIFCGSNFTLAYIDHCVIDGFTYAYRGENSSGAAGGVSVFATEIKNCTVGVIWAWFQILVDSCYIHDNTGTAILKNSTQNSHVSIVRTILAVNTIGIDTTNFNNCFTVSGCTIAGNTSDGVTTAGLGIWTNNIFYGNGGWGINGIPSGIVGFNAFGANSSGAVNGAYNNLSTVTLSADPFTDSAGGDYSLNATAGGGAACKNAAYQWA